MSNIIQIKRGTEQQVKVANLEKGELCIDKTNNLLYYGNDDGVNTLLGTKQEIPLPISKGGTGAITQSGALINLMNNVAIGSNSLPIYWSGSSFQTITDLGSIQNPLNSIASIQVGTNYLVIANTNEQSYAYFSYDNDTLYLNFEDI